MSSHREAPEIAKDPVADGTDVYAFVSPERPEHVTLIANFIPLQKPDGGPNFYEFGDDVLYEIHVATTGEARAGHRRTGSGSPPRSATTRRSSTTPGRSTTIGDPTWNRPQFYSRHPGRLEGRQDQGDRAGKGLRVPPVNVGKRSTPELRRSSRAQAVHTLGGRKVFAGQRADAFHVDLGSIFDLGALRPFNEAHLISMPNMNGVNAVQSYNVHTIALQVPIKELTRDGGLPDRPVASPARSSACGRRPAGASRGCGTRTRASTSATGRGSRSPGWPTRCSTRSSCRWPRRTSGTPGRRGTTSRYTKYVNKPELARAAARALPGRLPEPGGVHQAARRPERHPDDRHPAGRRPRVPELHRRRCRPTCCGSTWPSRRRASPTTSAWWPGTRPASPTAAGSTTTW